jgi:hypothetical protein
MTDVQMRVETASEYVRREAVEWYERARGQSGIFLKDSPAYATARLMDAVALVLASQERAPGTTPLGPPEPAREVRAFSVGQVMSAVEAAWRETVMTDAGVELKVFLSTVKRILVAGE